MIKTIPPILLLVFSSILYADIDEGKEHFDASDCVQCHNVEKFKYRKDKVSNFNKLHKIVNSCAISSAAGLFDDEIKDVSLYLNKNYYHFDIKSSDKK